MDGLEKIIINNIQKLLAKNDLSQKALAKKINEPISSINDILNPNSRMKIKPRHIEKISKLFNIEPSALLIRSFSTKKKLIQECTEIYLLMNVSENVRTKMLASLEKCKKQYKSELKQHSSKKVRAIFI